VALRSGAPRNLKQKERLSGLGGLGIRGIALQEDVAVRQSIGKESDNLEENEFIGEDAGPIEHPMEGSSGARIAAFVFKTQKQHGISDRTLLDRAKVSPHTLKALRDGKAVEDDALQRLASAVEGLSREASEVRSDAEYWLGVARASSKQVGGRNKLALVLGVSGPYLGRVLSGKKPMTVELIRRLRELYQETQAGRSYP
jgi:transcriptional regulator with XRE-family HTH domain